jgi:hypothetical protein
VFWEFFSGDGNLTKAVRSLGVSVKEPQDLASGGYDWTKNTDVQALRKAISEITRKSEYTVLHFAPPCSTFSRARDRSIRTRLRTTRRPQGLPHKSAECKEANLIARNLAATVKYAADELGALVSIEKFWQAATSGGTGIL